MALSTFDTDRDGWTANTGSTNIAAASQGDGDSYVTWQPTGGNPSGFITHHEAGGMALDALVAPRKFLGNLAALVEPRFEFDYKQIAGDTPDYAVEIRIFGAGTAFSWIGSHVPAAPDQIPYPLPPSFPPGGPPQNPPIERPDSRWRHFTALLERSQWDRLSGNARFFLFNESCNLR